MNTISRRLLITGAASAGLLTAACNNGIGGTGGPQIDARVDESLNYLFTNYPGTRELRDKSAGMLVMPLVTEAGFGIGGSYGRGALRVGGTSVDYYSATQASFGLQIGAQQYAHVLFFMTEEALSEFRALVRLGRGRGREIRCLEQRRYPARPTPPRRCRRSSRWSSGRPA